MFTLISLYEDVTAYPARILSAYLKSKGFQCRLIILPDFKFGSMKSYQSPTDLYHDAIMPDVIELCKDSSLIGISFFTPDFPRARDLTVRLKEKLSVPVIWGGKHASADPENSLLYADMICRGEGEESLHELVSKIEGNKQYYDTRNIWFKKNGQIIKNDIRPLNADLDSIPFPDYSFDNHYVLQNNGEKIIQFTLDKFKEYARRDENTHLISYGTLFSRGCPYSCSYCFSFKKMYEGQKYLRFRSVDNLMMELKSMRQNFSFFQHVQLFDDNIFVLSPAEIEKFCRAFKETIGLTMEFAGHPNNITEEKLRYLVDAGYDRVHMGVQTGSKRTQEGIYHRHVSNETVLKATKTINKFKKVLYPSYDVIIDNPYENNEDLLETIKLILKFPKPFQVKLFSLTFYPGTELFERAIKDGIVSFEDKSKAYGKHYLKFQHRKIKYLNLVTPLLNRNVPNFVIEFLINKYIIFLFDRPVVLNVLFKMVLFIKSLKKTEKK